MSTDQTAPTPGVEELFDGSAASWQQRLPGQVLPTGRPALPTVLVEVGGTLGEQVRGLKARTAVRRERARRTFQESRHPERGLPVADNAQVLSFMGRMIAERRTIAIALLVINAAAGVIGLLVPKILGRLIDRVDDPAGDVLGDLNRMALLVAGIVALQASLNFLARRLSAVFGQDILASAREYVIRAILRLPLSTVESTGTGDLVTRVTRDVGAMAGSVRWALPNFIISMITAVLTIAAMVLNSWLLALPILFTMLALFGGVRTYFKDAPQGYITESASYAVLNTGLTETVTGARTVEALGLQDQRIAITDEDLASAGQAERYTMTLRAKLFAVTGLAYQLPLVLVVLLGGWAFSRGWVSLGQITVATLYVQQFSSPLERAIQTLNQMQMGMAATTRLLGIAEVPPDRTTTDERPEDEHLVGKDLRFAYREGHDVLHGIDLDLRPGERLAIVGPSGSGKSTLGRLLAGINAPRTGVVEVGDVDVMHLDLPVLRTEVALVTQEHHVFVGSVRDNIVLAREDTATDQEVWDALQTVAADDWVERLPEGIDTVIGAGHYPLTPAQAQQVALARLVIADPHTLVLDEATSLIDPHTARDVEGSMAALLADRTVVAIAHRLHTAHDAHRIAVVIDGRIVELGSHEQLMRLDGEYAALWRAWTS